MPEWKKLGKCRVSSADSLFFISFCSVLSRHAAVSLVGVELFASLWAPRWVGCFSRKLRRVLFWLSGRACWIQPLVPALTPAPERRSDVAR